MLSNPFHLELMNECEKKIMMRFIICTHKFFGDGNSLAQSRIAYKFEMQRLLEASRCTEVQFAVWRNILFLSPKSKWINSS